MEDVGVPLLAEVSPDEERGASEKKTNKKEEEEGARVEVKRKERDEEKNRETESPLKKKKLREGEKEETTRVGTKRRTGDEGKMEEKESHSPVEEASSPKRRSPRKKRFSFLELFAGLAGLSAAVGRILEGCWVATHDIKSGSDLADDDEFMRILRMSEKEQIDWTHMAPVCRTMSRARRNDKHGKVRVLRTDDRPEGFG